MSTRSRFPGMMQIVRFNPWFYTVGALVVIAGGAWLLAGASSWPAWMKWGCVAALATAAWWLAASLIVSHVIYDLSDWPRGAWLARALGGAGPARVVNVHAGFDETTNRVRQWLPASEIVSLNVFDESIHTERSLLRARACHPPCADTTAGRFDDWPPVCRDCDAVLILLTAHEFRGAGARRALLAQARQALRPGNHPSIILAEHTRDPANFLAFGPGFFHFHSARTWRSDWEAAGLSMVRCLRVTPFLRVWTLRAKDGA